jgi:hypothetical protein
LGRWTGDHSLRERHGLNFLLDPGEFLLDPGDFLLDPGYFLLDPGDFLLDPDDNTDTKDPLFFLLLDPSYPFRWI